MPCACKKNVPDYPGTEEWGPILWKLLHGLAERGGKHLDEELREWKRLLILTADIIPCDVCKKHYKQVILERPINILKLDRVAAYTFLRTWLWTLHNEINVENNKPELPFTELTPLYGDVDLRDTLWRLEPVMKVAILKSGVGYISWTKWSTSFRMILSLV